MLCAINGVWPMTLTLCAVFDACAVDVHDPAGSRAICIGSLSYVSTSGLIFTRMVTVISPMAWHALETPLSVCAWQPHWHILLARREAPSLIRLAAHGTGNQGTLVASLSQHTSHALQLCKLICPTQQAQNFYNCQMPRLLHVSVRGQPAYHFHQ